MQLMVLLFLCCCSLISNNDTCWYPHQNVKCNVNSILIKWRDNNVHAFQLKIRLWKTKDYNRHAFVILNFIGGKSSSKFLHVFTGKRNVIEKWIKCKSKLIVLFLQNPFSVFRFRFLISPVCFRPVSLTRNRITHLQTYKVNKQLMTWFFNEQLQACFVFQNFCFM